VRTTKDHRRTGMQAALFAGSAIVFGALVAANPFSAAAETGREDARGGSSDTSSGPNNSKPKSTASHPRPTAVQPKSTTDKPAPTHSNQGAIAPNPGAINVRPAPTHPSPEPIAADPEPVTSSPGAVAPDPGGISFSPDSVTNHAVGCGSIVVTDTPTGTVLVAPGADPNLESGVWKPVLIPEQMTSLDHFGEGAGRKSERDGVWVPEVLPANDTSVDTRVPATAPIPPMLESQHAGAFNLWTGDKHLRPGENPGLGW
jgi:hypothetical protein